MHDSKLIQSIKVLTKEEIEGVKELLYSDYLIKGSYKNECIRLFEYIMPYYPEFESEALDRNIALEEIFKGEGSKINRLEKTMSALLNIVDFYITHFLLSSNNNETKNLIDLSTFYRERNNKGRSKLLIKKANELIKQPKFKISDLEHYNIIYLRNCEELCIEDFIDGKFNPLGFLSLIDDIEEHSFLRKMNHLCRISFREGKVTKQTDDVFVRLYEDYEKNIHLQNNILINLFVQSLMLLKNCLDDNFMVMYSKFQEDKKKYSSYIDINFLKLFSFFEHCFIAKRYNIIPNYENLVLVHELYKKQLNAGFIIHYNILGSKYVYNFIVRSLRLKDVDWFKEFILDYQDKIGEPEERKDLVNLCWAAYYFMEKEYEKIDELLLQKYDDYYYQMLARRLRMKIYYETKEEVILTYEIDAHKVYVHRLYGRKEIDINHYEANTNFCNRLKQIINLRHNPDEKTKARLLEKVKSQKCSDSEWLLEKIEEIKVPYSKS